MWKPLLLTAGLALTWPAACTTPEDGGGASLAPTYGSVLAYPLDVTWSAVRPALSNLGATDMDLDGSGRTARARLRGVDVVLQLQAHTSGGTIVRVGASEGGRERRDVGDQVLTALQQMLLC